MATRLTAGAHPRDVRAFIAQSLLRDSVSPPNIGDVSLRPHQRAAVERLRRVIRNHGGALLADDVGLGKTYVAVTLIRDAKHPLVVAPAALRNMWRDALAHGHTTAELVSYNALSHGRAPAGPFDLLVLDEAHHARNPATRCYTRLATLATNAQVLLLSATPVHNNETDLSALLALFLGAHAWHLTEEQRTAYIVRRERDDVPNIVIPHLLPPTWLPVGDDAQLLEQISALPPPLPPRDGYDGGPLIAWGLARQWASSHGALIHALDRRLARAAALQDSLAVGRYPSRATLAAWACGDDAVQLSFPQLFHDTSDTAAPLLPIVVAHANALQSLRTRAQTSAWTDAERARRLRDVRANHPGEKIVAFSQFADTVRTLFGHLRDEPGVASLTAHGGRVAGGTLSRSETLVRFAPRALGARPPRDIERIDLLLTTDLLSEGINLHDASVVVHLDLPWTPARLEQRVGRARRLGSAHTHTAVYAMSPPASSEALLQVEQRLLHKLRAAAHAIGVAGTILPTLAPTPFEPTTARQHEMLMRVLARWLGPPTTPPIQHTVHTARGRTTRPCVLALFDDGDARHLAASVDDRPLDDAAVILLEAATLVDAAIDLPPNNARRDTEAAPLSAALDLAQQWIARRAVTAATGGAFPLHAPGRRQAMRRLATITARAPHHRRPTLAPLAERARRAITLPFGIGAERVLHQLAAAPLPDEAWLRALGTFADTQQHARQPPEHQLTLIAIIVGAPPPDT